MAISVVSLIELRSGLGGMHSMPGMSGENYDYGFGVLLAAKKHLPGTWARFGFFCARSTRTNAARQSAD